MRPPRPRLLLEMLTPIAKSWPSEWCLEANSLAIQVLGGYGYTRDFPVEQYWRDNRLNMIHEGTHGIQALDLLGRKVVMHDGAGLRCWPCASSDGRARDGVARTGRATPTRSAAALAARRRCNEGRLADRRTANEALANATPYLQAFGHTVLAWVWLDVALCAADGAQTSPAPPRPATMPRCCTASCAACRYFIHYELPRVGAWLRVVETRDDTCRNMDEAWF